MEVEAIDEGVLAKILVSDGTDNVAVNTPIAILAGEGEEVSAAALKGPAQGGGEPLPAPGPPPPATLAGAGERVPAAAPRAPAQGGGEPPPAPGPSAPQPAPVPDMQ